jgi:manganese transport protein
MTDQDSVIYLDRVRPMPGLMSRLPVLWNGPSPLAVRRVLPVLGPGYIVAVGYIDAGNWATDVDAGARYGFALLAVVLAASLAAAFLQALSIRLTLASGSDLARLIREHLPRPVALLCWVAAEIAMVATDLAELLGSAVAFRLLFGMSIEFGVVLAAIISLTLLTIPSTRGRFAEYAIGLMLLVVAGCFAYELALAQPPLGDVLRGFLPHTAIVTDPNMLYLSIGIIGATIMPHNLYLHSGLARGRAAELRHLGTRGRLRFLSFDSWTMLGLACLANAAIVVIATMAFGHGATGSVGLEQAYRMLDPVFGSSAASIVFAIGLLAAGLSAAATAGMAGQIVLEGFLDLRVPIVLRALITRGAALVPALVLPLMAGPGGVDRLLVLSQVTLGLTLPFVLLPMLVLLASRKVMRRLPVGRVNLAIGRGLTIILIALNLWLAGGSLY